MLLSRNVSLERIGSRARVFRSRDLQTAQVVISVTRPFVVRAGMTVYVWMPVSLWSAFQSHPFAIVWWENNGDGKATSITLLVQKRSGFTRRLLHHQNTAFIAWVDGPYGIPMDLKPYNRILMVATGIGIAAQISYIKELLEINMRHSVIGRNIFVVWEVDDDSKWGLSFLE